jgi:adenylosuccinate synthase
MINGIERVAITKLDVLSNLDEIKVCIGYELDGKRLKSFPTTETQLNRITPIYETLPGWKKDITEIRKYEDLPIETKNYLGFIAEHSGFEISIISVGPKRSQTIEL